MNRERTQRGNQGRRGRSRPAGMAPRARRTSSGLLVTAIAVLLGLAFVGTLSIATQPTPSASISGSVGVVAPARLTPAAGGSGPSIGSQSASLALDLYTDFQCPACATFDRDILPSLVADFVTPGYIRFTEHDVAFLGNTTPGEYDESLEAAAAASCAGREGMYWPYHDWLFANQMGENRGAFSRSRLDAIAAKIGLDVSAFGACMSGQDVRAAIRAGTQSALSTGLASTPSLYIDGQPADPLQPYAQLATYLRSRLHIQS